MQTQRLKYSRKTQAVVTREELPDVVSKYISYQQADIARAEAHVVVQETY